MLQEGWDPGQGQDTAINGILGPEHTERFRRGAEQTMPAATLSPSSQSSVMPTRALSSRGTKPGWLARDDRISISRRGRVQQCFLQVRSLELIPDRPSAIRNLAKFLIAHPRLGISGGNFLIPDCYKTYFSLRNQEFGQIPDF